MHVVRTTQASVLSGKRETMNQGPDDDELIILCSLHTFLIYFWKKTNIF